MPNDPNAQSDRMPVDPENRVWPKVTPIEKVDLYDPIAMFEARDQFVRQQWVEAMKTRIIHEKMVRCSIREGPDAPEHCRHLIRAYKQRLDAGSFKSWRQVRKDAALAGHDPSPLDQ